MTDKPEDTLKRDLTNSVPRWVMGFCAAFLCIAFSLQWMGFDFSGPIQMIAFSYAEAYKAEQQHRAEVALSLDEIEQRLEHLESLAHAPGQTK